MRLSLLLIVAVAACCSAQNRPPNIVYVMTDELAYFELGHMGNKYVKTPRIDRMASEGMRFTRAYAGAPVCAPLRCNLMTGKHAGHASVRANDGGTPLRADEATIASLLKAKGYATGGFGKWGCGGRGSTGVPEKHGFDVFLGYYDQVHAHSFYPPYIIRNSAEVPLAGNIGGRSGKTYSHDVIMDAGLQFIRENKDKPFFAYFPITPPHGMYDIPADHAAWDVYEDVEWIKDPNLKQDIKNYAAMVSLVDRNVGQILDLLKELGLEENTIVFFTGDNGGQDRFKSKEHPRGFFGPNVNPVNGVEFRGGKGNLYEGGLRIPYMVRWPGKIEGGRVSDLVFYQPDVLPTLTELAKAETPADIDGISIVPTLLGSAAAGREQERHPHLYWEYGNQVAVRIGHWKGVHDRRRKSWQLFDLAKDVSEKNDVSAQHPELVARMATVAAAEHEPARPGTYSDRERHERDRRAKWGTARPQPRGGRRGGRRNRITAKNLIPAKRMKLVRVSSENVANGKFGVNAIDGKPRSIWHSRWSNDRAEHPHELVIDLGGTYRVTGFRYLARQDNSWNGAFGKTEFAVASSIDGFGAAAAAATFAKVRTAQAADCKTPVEGRYVRVRVLSEVGGRPFASAAEIGVIGTKVP